MPAYIQNQIGFLKETNGLTRVVLVLGPSGYWGMLGRSRTAQRNLFTAGFGMLPRSQLSLNVGAAQWNRPCRLMNAEPNFPAPSAIQ